MGLNNRTRCFEVLVSSVKKLTEASKQEGTLEKAHLSAMLISDTRAYSRGECWKDSSQGSRIIRQQDVTLY